MTLSDRERSAEPKSGASAWVLDTDTCIGWLRRHPAVVERIRESSPADLAVATMTEAELRFGAMLSRQVERNLEQVEWILESGLAILPFDRTAARHHAELRLELRAQPIGDRDLVVAAVARANGCGVVTGNVRGFRRIAGLVVENWMSPG